jgi:hypothetical protein
MKYFASLFLTLAFFTASWAEFIIDEPSSPGNNPQPQRASQSFFFSGGNQNLEFLGTVNTFDTLGKGTWSGKIFLYENGGFGFRFHVGIFDVLDIGISEGIENVIGMGNPEFFIPGAYAKLHIIKNLYHFNWTIGFDTFGYGERSLVVSSHGNRDMLYGFYTVCGWKWSGFGNNDYFLIGLRFPLLPTEMRRWDTVAAMAGVSFHLGQYFFVSATIEHLFFNTTLTNRVLPTLIAGFTPSQNFELQILFPYQSEANAFSRQLSLSYNSRF